MEAEPKVAIVAIKTLFGVLIQNRGGDSAEWHYFETPEDATLAAAADGSKDAVCTVGCWQLSDGRYCRVPEQITVSAPPTREQVEKIAKSVSPAQRLALERTRPGT